MRKIKRIWMRFSLEKKITAIIIWIMIIMTISEGVIVGLTQSSLREFEKIMENNSVYQELQEVIKKEQETFIAYIRNRTQENKLAFEYACEESEKCIGALPFEYEEIGQERYARTWNILNGYTGYKSNRDMVTAMTEEDDNYIEELYEVLGMQENLSAYALRLVQVTQEQWNAAYEEKMEFMQSIPLIVLLVILLVLMSTVGIWHLLSKTLVQPLILVAQDSRRIAVNEFETPELSIENEDEIGELVTAFNKMKKAMKSYISTLQEKNRIAELLHKEEMEKMELEKHMEHTQLEVLKHQVNPHFLFNTLNMISGMAMLEEASVTGKMIISLGNLFRYNLRTVEQEVYLEQEIEVVEDYVYIQQMRFDNRIEYEKIIEVDEKKMKIPSFTLQPIVENAFVHGLRSKEEGGRIILKIWEEKGNIIITITDNGAGIEEELLEEINDKIHKVNTSGRGIGLGNICRRIDMMYQEGKVEILSKKEEGTTVRLEIPIKQQEKKAESDREVVVSQNEKQ